MAFIRDEVKISAATLSMRNFIKTNKSQKISAAGHEKFRQGFTLIEIAIVVVIIGLISAGILVGRDLIEAAEMRSQIRQIEEFDLAKSAFRLKYNGVPGDLPPNTASSVGFTDRSGANGQGDDDGVVETCDVSSPFAVIKHMGCENILFWSDLSAANLINQSFTAASNTALTDITTVQMQQYFPRMKLKSDHFILAYSGSDRRNNYIMGRFIGINASGFPLIDNNENLSGRQAYGIDSKIDDGMPLTGGVTIHSIVAPNIDYFFGDPIQDPNGCVNADSYNLTSGRALNLFCMMAIEMK